MGTLARSLADRGLRGVERGAAALLVQLRSFLLEALEHLQRLPALVHQAEPTEHAGEDVVVGGRARVEDDRLIQSACRGIEAAVALLGPALLKPRSIGLRIERRWPCRACSSAFSAFPVRL